MVVHIHYICSSFDKMCLFIYFASMLVFIKDYTLLITSWLFLPASPSVSPELLSAYSGSLSLSSALDPPSPVTWFPLTLRATLAPPPLRRHPPTHTHGRPHRGLCFSKGAAAGGRCRRLQWFSVSDDGSFQHMVPTCPAEEPTALFRLQEREKKQASALRSALSLILTPTKHRRIRAPIHHLSVMLLKKPERNE